MSQSDESVPPLRLPPEALRRIDWLALAPWLLILRAPSATLGWPLLVGSVAMVLLGLPVSPAADSQPPAAPLQGLAAAGSQYWVISAVSVAGWLAATPVLGPCAAARFLDWPDKPGVNQLWGAVTAGRRLIVAWSLLALAGGILLLGLLSLKGVLSVDWAQPVASLLYGPSAFIFAVPLALTIALGAAGAPMLIAAIALDDSDAFDAISRTVAYTFHRPFTLGFCVLVAALAGGASAVIVEALIASADLVFRAVGVPNPEVDGDSLGQASLIVFERALRGFYPAYLFTAGAAIYLVMRQAIDGQPLDERGPTAGQSADA